MICPNCEKHYSEEFNFCPYCGKKNPIFKICPICEYKTYDKEFMFCPECGKELISEMEYKLQLISEIEYELKQEIEKEFLRKDEERKKRNPEKKESTSKNISSSTVSAETYRKMKNVKISGKAKYGW